MLCTMNNCYLKLSYSSCWHFSTLQLWIVVRPMDNPSFVNVLKQVESHELNWLQASCHRRTYNNSPRNYSFLLIHHISQDPLSVELHFCQNEHWSYAKTEFKWYCSNFLKSGDQTKLNRHIQSSWMNTSPGFHCTCSWGVMLVVKDTSLLIDSGNEVVNSAALLGLGNLDTWLSSMLKIQFTSRAGKSLSHIRWKVLWTLQIVTEVRSQVQTQSLDPDSKKALAVKWAAKLLPASSQNSLIYEGTLGFLVLSLSQIWGWFFFCLCRIIKSNPGPQIGSVKSEYSESSMDLEQWSPKFASSLSLTTTFLSHRGSYWLQGQSSMCNNKHFNIWPIAVVINCFFGFEEPDPLSTNVSRGIAIWHQLGGTDPRAVVLRHIKATSLDWK